MQTLTTRVLLIFLSSISLHCKKNSTVLSALIFDTVPIVKQLNPSVNEISGIATSILNTGFLFAHEDSGTPPQLHLLKIDGTVTGSIYIKGITNRDWEDMAIVNNEVYIAETGDNNQTHSSYKFYKFAEPASTTDTIRNVETINFTYPDGPHDAEAFLADAATKNIYIITKRDNVSKIYRLSFPYGTTNIVTLVGTLPYNGVVSAAASPDAKEIIIKTYTSLFYYSRSAGETIEQSLQKAYTSLSYTAEPQGEAICFAANNSGFYTISEKATSSTVNMYFYKRN